MSTDPLADLKSKHFVLWPDGVHDGPTRFLTATLPGALVNGHTRLLRAGFDVRDLAILQDPNVEWYWDIWDEVLCGWATLDTAGHLWFLDAAEGNSLVCWYFEGAKEHDPVCSWPAPQPWRLTPDGAFTLDSPGSVRG